MEIISILALVLVIISLLVERYFFAKKMLQQVDDALKAAMSKDVHEYVFAKKAEVRKDTPPAEPETAELSELSDDEFKKFITKQ